MLTVKEEKVDFEARLATWLVGAQKIVTDHTTRNFPSLPIPQLSIVRGKRYIKIVRHDHPNQVGRSVHCFIDTTNGDVLKAASWSAPAKTARGNILDEKNGLGWMSEYGPAYLQFLLWKKNK